MSGEKALLSDLGFSSLLRTSAVWTLVFILISFMMSLLVSDSSARSTPNQSLSISGCVLIVYVALFVAIILTLMTGISLWRGFSKMRRHGRNGLAAFIGAWSSLIGSMMALIGVLMLLISDAGFAMGQGMKIDVGSTLIYMLVPLPWPVPLGLSMWLIGIAVIGFSLLPSFRKSRDALGLFSAIMLVASVAFVIIPLVCFSLLTVASAIIVFGERGVWT